MSSRHRDHANAGFKVGAAFASVVTGDGAFRLASVDRAASWRSVHVHVFSFLLDARLLFLCIPFAVVSPT